MLEFVGQRGPECQSLLVRAGQIKDGDNVSSSQHTGGEINQRLQEEVETELIKTCWMFFFVFKKECNI